MPCTHTHCLPFAFDISTRRASTLVVVIGGGAFAFSRWLASKKDFVGLDNYASAPGDARRQILANRTRGDVPARVRFASRPVCSCVGWSFYEFAIFASQHSDSEPSSSNNRTPHRLFTLLRTPKCEDPSVLHAPTHHVDTLCCSWLLRDCRGAPRMLAAGMLLRHMARVS